MGRQPDDKPGRKPLNAPRPCPTCGTETPAAPDKRFDSPTWRWDCNEHGVFAFLVVLDPLR